MTMLERLARALCVSDDRDPDSVPIDYHRQMNAACDPNAPRWVDYLHHARTAAFALREPTEAMIAAGQEACADGYAGDPATIWRMMAIAALSETCVPEAASS